MKALVYTQPNEVQLQEYPSPTPGEEEVVLRIDAVGICGSDMHAYHGHDPRRKPGLVLGHEFAGTVVETRSSLFAKGARVTGNPLITCGYCDYCVQGRNNLCSNRTMVGMTRPGAFAEYMSIPASCLISLPDDMSADIAALTEPAATALHAVDLSKRALKLPINHSLPWMMAYQEFASFFAAIVLVFSLLSGVIRLSFRVFVFFLISLIPLIQYAAGVIVFSGDAWVVFFYLLAFSFMLLVGYNLSVEPASRAFFAYLLAVLS